MKDKELKLPIVAGFHIKEQIGGGGFSVAANPKLDIVAACKVVALTPSTTKQERKELNKEIQVHSSLKHTNILEFINAVIVEPDGKSPWIPGVYMLLEIAAGGDLFDKIAPDVGVDEEMAHLYFNQLVEGMKYVHEQGVVHRDLKPENLLLDITGQVKISDFGLCSVYRYKGQTRQLTEQCGSLPYVAPEVQPTLFGNCFIGIDRSSVKLVHAPERPYFAEPVDIWGMGVILFTLFCGNTPWDQPTEEGSPEYARYLTGHILSESPWSRIPEDALFDQSGIELAEHLTRALRVNGDLELAEPNLNPSSTQQSNMEEMMFSTHAASQFTQTLQLFSQTQSGQRYCPHLTRFYTSTSPDQLMSQILIALENFGVKFQIRDPDPSESDKFIPTGFKKTKVGGYDKRRERFTGYIEIENFSWDGGERHGSFCVMRREKVP
ncbi:hypothetical protein Clacol_007242 [Clathrus columnatus]|uniref:Protein kinase domain-containing protein n=1 Tax=Clathrus columnatus TaxID=1419009 RepID=A0AAV5AHL6_9AGAM|nr:hypothetical protein Clacol_007242 [Clathrus columnatus]